MGDQHDRRAARPELGQGRRRAPAGWAGRRRRSARRGRTARARRPARGRSAPAAAGRRRAGRRRRGPGRRGRRPRARRRSRPGRRATSGRSSRRRREPAGGDDLPHRGGYAGRGAGPLRHEADPVPVVEVVERGAEQLERRRRSAGSSPVSARTSVDLPEPLAPSSATNSPVPTVRSMPRRTGRPPMATAPSRELDDRVAHEQPFACWSAARFCLHQGKVVLVGGLVGQPLDRVEHGGRDAEVARRGSRRARGWPAARRRRW